jgi:hypothetical protein
MMAFITFIAVMIFLSFSGNEKSETEKLGRYFGTERRPSCHGRRTADLYPETLRRRCTSGPAIPSCTSEPETESPPSYFVLVGRNSTLTTIPQCRWTARLGGHFFGSLFIEELSDRH